MTLKFIHFEYEKSDTFIDFDKIAYVQRIENVVFIYFEGNSKPIQLRGGAAKTFERILFDSSVTIYISDSTVEDEQKLSSESDSK